MVNQATALLIETGKALNWGGSTTVAPRIDLTSGDHQDRLDERHEPDNDKQLNLEIQLGHTRLAPDEASSLRNGSVVVLDEAIGEPVAIVVDSRPIGRGEIVVIDGKIGVRIVELAETSFIASQIDNAGSCLAAVGTTARICGRPQGRRADGR
jgi:flagellar motor switch protein FliN